MKTISTYIHRLVLFAALACVPAISLHAFTSSNYSIDSYSIGAGGVGAAQSAGFEYTYGAGSSYESGEGEVVVESDNSSGGRFPSIIKKIYDAEVDNISQSNIVPVLYDDSAQVQQTEQLRPIYNPVVIEDSSTNTPEQVVPSNSAVKQAEDTDLDINEVTTYELLSQTSQRERVIIAIAIFIWLLYFRLFTNIGKKWFPF